MTTMANINNDDNDNPLLTNIEVETSEDTEEQYY